MYLILIKKPKVKKKKIVPKFVIIYKHILKKSTKLNKYIVTTY